MGGKTAAKVIEGERTERRGGLSTARAQDAYKKRAGSDRSLPALIAARAGAERVD
jgi:hypothetical protein